MKEIHKGDWVRTPRFCEVKIEEVFNTREEAAAAGYTEPTHFYDTRYGVSGKSLRPNYMDFAAYRK